MWKLPMLKVVILYRSNSESARTLHEGRIRTMPSPGAAERPALEEEW
jgi:hypothetical protein